METKEFLEKVLGDGYYSVLGLGDKKVQSFHATIDDVIKKANELDAEGINAYFGLATFEPDKDRRINISKNFALYIESVRKDYGNDEVTRISNYLQRQYGKNKNEISRSLYQSGYDKAPHIRAMLIVDNVEGMQASEKAIYNMLEDVYDLPNFLSKETIEEANILLEERYKEGYLKYKIKLNPKKRK